MKFKTGQALLWILLLMLGGVKVCAQPKLTSELRLIPFPQEVQFEPGSFSLNRHLVLEVSQGQAQVLADQIALELKNAGYTSLTMRPLKTGVYFIRLATRTRSTIKKLPLRPEAGPEDYALQVQPMAITITGGGPAGLFYGVQSLRQLIRANRHDGTLPSLLIHDWPSLEWRGFQDDLTRGPSSTLANLEGQAALGAFLKLNIFTYYMESQFAFRKHLAIGPKDGSLTAEELKALVAFTQPLQLNILGNQQSFGHFDTILAHPEFKELRETPGLLCPTNPRTYELLDDLYSEVAPLLPFPFFNVCCDEVEGLGKGPSKALVEQIGEGGVYVRHIRRVHDLVAGKYQKQMMMWGDIILQHPTNLNQVPKDTILLTWGYDARGSFDNQITPFQKAGFKFFVCPGVNNWNRILPAFSIAITNIQNFVRDGVKLGAIGMLNTAWDDDSQTFNAPNWHGFAWGADCAWNASKTTPYDFNRRIGAVLFGEKGDHFGRAIEALAASGSDGMPNSAFWHFEFGPIKVHNPEGARTHWQKLLDPVRAATTELEACKQDAVFNRELLDYFLFGTHRMELCYQRELDRLQAALAYREARRKPLVQALPLLEKAESALQSSRNSHEQLCHQFAELWQQENKPYALNRTLAHFSDLLDKFDRQIDRLVKVRLAAKPDRSLPTPREVNLELIDDQR